MERFIAKKLKIKDRIVEFSPVSVLQSLVKTTLKTMFELCREEYFNNNGFNQIQIDILLIFCVIKSLILVDDQG